VEAIASMLATSVRRSSLACGERDVARCKRDERHDRIACASVVAVAIPSVARYAVTTTPDFAVPSSVTCTGIPPPPTPTV